MVQEISFHIVKFSLIFGILRLFMMTTNLFVIANVKQLRTDGSFRILLHFFRKSCGVGVLNSAIFNSFLNGGDFGTILEGVRNFGRGRRFEPPTPPLRYATDGLQQTVFQHISQKGMIFDKITLNPKYVIMFVIPVMYITNYIAVCIAV